jgi:hypothetical protein
MKQGPEQYARALMLLNQNASYRRCFPFPASFLCNAQGETRTRKGRSPADFESFNWRRRWLKMFADALTGQRLPPAYVNWG